MKYEAERRRHEPIKVNIPTQWEGVLEQQSGNIVDLSMGGCFILTAHQVELHELIRINIGPLFIWGEVIYHVAEMGFAIKFNALIGDQERQLGRIIERAKVLAKQKQETSK